MAEKNGTRHNGRAARATVVRTDSRSRRKVRVAILGVGNCASSLVQGVEYYRDAKPGASIPGLMHVDLGGYHIRDIEFSAAFDIDKDKVGKDLADAIFSGHNNTVKFAEVPHLGVRVERGMTHDGLGKYLSEIITKAPGPTADIVGILKATKTDVVVNYLPVGSEEAVKWYAEQVLDAGCAFVNCMPVFLARESYWRGRFEKRCIPIIGDDIKSQVGATIVRRRATERRAEAGGLGFTEFRRRRDRRHPMLQARARPKARRRARRAVIVLHEVAPHPVHRWGRASADRGVHRRNGGERSRRCRRRTRARRRDRGGQIAPPGPCRLGD